MGLIVILPKVTALYTPALFEAEPFKGTGAPRYTGTFMYPAGGAVDKRVQAACEEVGKEAFGKSWDAKWKEWLLSKGDCPFTNGDVKDQEWAHGNYILAAHRAEKKGAPAIVNRNPKEFITLASGIIYGGCMVNAKIEIWPQTKDYPGMRATLISTQFVAGGEPLGGGGPATAEGFEDLSVDDDDMMAGF